MSKSKSNIPSRDKFNADRKKAVELLNQLQSPSKDAPTGFVIYVFHGDDTHSSVAILPDVYRLVVLESLLSK